MHPSGCSVHCRSCPDARPLARLMRGWRSPTADTVRKMASSRLTNVDRVSLIIVDDTFASAPRRFVHGADERNSLFSQVVRRRRDISGLEVEMEMLSCFDVRNRGIWLVDQFQVN